MIQRTMISRAFVFLAIYQSFFLNLPKVFSEEISTPQMSTTRRSVVQLRAQVPSSNDGIFCCGIVIHRSGIVLTTSTLFTYPEVTNGSGRDHRLNPILYDLIDADFSSGIALVQLRGNTDFEFIHLMDDVSASDGDNVVAEAGLFDSPVATLKGTIANSQFPGMDRNQMLLQLPMVPGAGGSPVFDSHSRVIGILDKPFRESPVFTLAISTDSLSQSLLNLPAVVEISTKYFGKATVPTLGEGVSIENVFSPELMAKHDLLRDAKILAVNGQATLGTVDVALEAYAAAKSDGKRPMELEVSLENNRKTISLLTLEQ